MAEVRLNYSKATFVPNLLLSIVGLGLLDAFAILTFSFDLVSQFTILLVSIFVVLVLGISPFLTYHRVEEGELTLRQGWYFKAVIPLHDIVSVEELEKGRTRTGVFFDLRGSELYVTTQRRGLLVIKLAEPRRFALALGKKVDKIVFDTTDRRDLGRAFGDRFIPASQDRSS
jgi:hypothetical protein